MTPGELLQRRLRADGARPLLTWYDDATDERIELSVATAANWAAKTANLMTDEHGLEPGDTVTLSPPSHWLAFVAALGAWTAGVALDLTSDARVPALPGDPAHFMRAVLPQPDALLNPPAAGTDIAVVTGDREWSLDDITLVDTDPADDNIRVMTTLPLNTVDGLLVAIVHPLRSGGSCVMLASADSARLPARAETERVTHTAGCDVPGLPRVR